MLSLWLLSQIYCNKYISVRNFARLQTQCVATRDIFHDIFFVAFNFTTVLTYKVSKSNIYKCCWSCPRWDFKSTSLKRNSPFYCRGNSSSDDAQCTKKKWRVMTEWSCDNRTRWLSQIIPSFIASSSVFSFRFATTFVYIRLRRHDVFVFLEKRGIDDDANYLRSRIAYICLYILFVHINV